MFTRLICLFILVVAAAPARACRVPVFRYALERWPADPYEIRFDAGSKAALQGWLNENGSGNFALREDEPGSATGTLRLFRPGGRGSVWEGPVSRENASAIVDSPARRLLAERIFSGNSVVWVFLPGKDAAENQAVRDLLAASISQAPDQFSIPDGVVGQDAVESGAFSGDPEDVVSDAIPLKIEFSMIEVQRSDPAEKVFLAMLMSIEEDLPSLSDSPMVFPAFGRGRILEPLVGKGIVAANLDSYASYLCGSCSCEVKQRNPGMDLLLATNWEKIENPAPQETVLFSAATPPPARGFSWIPLACGILLLAGAVLILRSKGNTEKT